MTALERVQMEIDRLAEIAKRRALWEDEQQAITIYRQVAKWIGEDAALGMTPAPEPELVAVGAGDEEKKIKDVFASYREKLKREGRMR